MIALAHYPARPEAESAPETLSGGGEGYSYGRGMAGLAGDGDFDDEGDEDEGVDAAGEPAAAAGPQLGGAWQAAGGGL